MNIRFLVIGRPTSEYRALISEYEKRLPKYARFECLEVKAEKDIEPKIMGVLVILDSHGQALSSESLAQYLKQHQEITFVIGGDVGLSDAFKKKANLLLSFGKITLPHQLARLVLTEQVYRACTILKGEPYHK